MFGAGPFRAFARRFPGVAVIGVSLGLAACSATPISFVLRAPVTIAASGPSAQYFPVANSICRVTNLAGTLDSNKRCRVIASTGAVKNVALVRRGRAKFGLTQSDLADGAFRGQGLFAELGAARNLRSVVGLHRETFTILAGPNTNIRSFEDLRGRRIGIGKVGAGHTFTRDIVLDLYGWTISDFDRLLELGPVDQSETLCAGRVDAIIFEAVHPDGLTQEATSRCGANLVHVARAPIDKLFARPYYDISLIPGGMYENNPDNTVSFGTQTILVTSAHQPDDVVYAVVKAIFENFEDFRRLHPALVALKRDALVSNEALLPIHPGALRYFREAGLVPSG